mgnify:CR=1 FL=1
MLGVGDADEGNAWVFKSDTQRVGLEPNPTNFRSESNSVRASTASQYNSTYSNYAMGSNMKLNGASSQHRSLHMAAEPVPVLRRAKSIMGTCGFMGMYAAVFTVYCVFGIFEC